MSDAPPAAETSPDEIITSTPKPALNTEDWWSIWLGASILIVSLAAVWASRPADLEARTDQFVKLRAEADALAIEPGSAPADVKQLRKEVDAAKKKLAVNPLKPWLGKIGGWSDDPAKALLDKSGKSVLPGLFGVWLISLLLFGCGRMCMGRPVAAFPLAFSVLFLLAVVAQILAGQEVIKHYNLEYALWALVVGLLISNTIGTPGWLRSAVQTEFYIKTGLVLLGGGPLQPAARTRSARRVRRLGGDTGRADLDLHLRAEGAEDRIPIAQHGDLRGYVRLRRLGGDRDWSRLQSEEGRASHWPSDCR